MGQLAEHGYTLVNDMDTADICVVNSCTVKNPSESRGLHLATWLPLAVRVGGEVRSWGKPAGSFLGV